MSVIKLEDLPYYTYDDYKNWEGNWELVYGIAYSMRPNSTIKHQAISSSIACELSNIFQNCEKSQSKSM